MIEYKDGRARFVYEIDEEDIEELDKDFYDWLKKQGDNAMFNAISAYSDEFNEVMFDCIYSADNLSWDCLKQAKRVLEYKEDE